ncbi:uncharacterized protein N7443_003982 [Penicillium atrosanguineum]|uniref:Uncharacterized protein n=1 Tax=Penicillium atrosanguineum TaxID=1132637 RepID=A0A9W9Q7P5_9EURO|nr:uncharacterized protein N7443_003982 [Penicillium atrosanguineum]KAJ5304322.1 hypothetical protein N7443_003982 [Penicillium atrosanguineum]KAJ5323796.1 hypothetical protein N7476_002396 [Penicillium atrosanguineum]
MKNLLRHTVGFASACSAYASSFHVFDNTAYLNTSIGYGTTNINWIPAYVCNPLTEGGVLPSADAWKEIVLEWNVYPSYPLVIDCEDLYFNDDSKADLYLEIMSTLQTWAADVIPSGQVIGWYGLSGNTVSGLYDHYRSLIANYSSHAFFPSAYTYSSSLTTWHTSLTTVLKTINTINDSLPVWPYTWPQYHGNYSFIPSDLWEDELEILADNADVNGFVIWGGKNHAVCNDNCQDIAGTEPWLNVTRTYLKTLYGIYSGGAAVAGSQLFSGV